MAAPDLIESVAVALQQDLRELLDAQLAVNS
jgi:hypothetical protein